MRVFAGKVLFLFVFNVLTIFKLNKTLKVLIVNSFKIKKQSDIIIKLQHNRFIVFKYFLSSLLS